MNIKTITYCCYFVIFLLSCPLRVNSATIAVPIVNPGAETGDTSGWNSEGITALDSGDHHSGNYHFAVDNNLLDHLLQGATMGMHQLVDLSAYAGHIQDISAKTWALFDSAMAEGLKDGQLYYYPLSASIGFDFYDTGGHHIYGIYETRYQSRAWLQFGPSATNYLYWDQLKDYIGAVDLNVFFQLDTYGKPSIDQLDSISWVVSPQNLSLDDVSLEIEVSSSPTPSAILLLVSGLGAIGLFKRKVA